MYPIHLKFVVYGASGAGKDALIELMQKIAPNVTIHKKDTTRPARVTERSNGSNTLNFVSEAEFHAKREQGEYDIVHKTYGNWYGLRRDQLTKAFNNKEIHFIILRDISSVQQFKYMYSDVKAIYIHADPENIPARLRQRDGVNFEERLKRTREEYKEFIENNTLFDHVILNFWDIDNAVRQLRNVLHLYMRKSTSNL